MIRLGQLAATMVAAGRLPLPTGAALVSLELRVAVAEPPVLEQDRLWRLAVARPLPRWRRWLSGLIPGRGAGDWPWIKLTWSDGIVFASLISPPPALFPT